MGLVGWLPKLKLDITGIDQNNAIALKHSIIKNTSGYSGDTDPPFRAY